MKRKAAAFVSGAVLALAAAPAVWADPPPPAPETGPATAASAPGRRPTARLPVRARADRATTTRSRAHPGAGAHRLPRARTLRDDQTPRYRLPSGAPLRVVRPAESLSDARKPPPFFMPDYRIFGV